MSTTAQRPAHVRRSMAAHPSGRGAPDRPTSGPDVHRPGPGRPDVERLARLVALTFLEVEAGRRPFSQLEPLLAPALVLRLRPRCRRPCAPRAGSVLAVSLTAYDEDHVEASAVVDRGGRVGAVAIRLERHAGAWRVTELARPEDR